MKVSFLMMARNVEAFLGDAIEALQSCDNAHWELILVDDHSDDSTYQIAVEKAKDDSRIRVFLNPYRGVVRGTSFAFQQSTGEIIKCIDSDDILLCDFFSYVDLHKQHDVLFHSALIVDVELHTLARYQPNPSWFADDFEAIASRLVSLPKWSWSFTRPLAEKIFPLPEDLPIEDIWMSLILKKYCKTPLLISVPLYKYRQHQGQIWGGVLNYSKIVTKKRAESILAVVDVLRGSDEFCNGNNSEIFNRAVVENEFLLGKARFRQVVKSRRTKLDLFRIALLRYFPYPLPLMASIKWWVTQKLAK